MNKPHRLILLAVTALAAGAIPSQAAWGGATAARSRSVSLKGKTFRPRTVKIRHGGTVTWRWRDGKIRHNVIGTGFHSRTQAKGKFTVRFPSKGTYRYVCTLHSGMTGAVVVS